MATTIIETNEFQTSITKELLEQYSDEVREQFMDFIDTVPLLKWMISKDRPRAKDLPRDEQGRIIVDITHPHILEDMDYFRPAAKFYEENGCYSLLRPNSNPNSEYGKWFYEEVRRCRDGYVRESDGEWVTGLMYFFLNYSIIMLTRKSEKSKVAKRVEGFPDVWEGIYYRCHYLEQARRSGKHGLELARRGCGKSFLLASMMSHNLILGENSEVTKRVTTVLTAYLKEYLSEKDGTLSKFTPMIDFLAQNTEFPRLMYKRSQAEMTWIMGYKNSNGNIIGSRNSVLGLSVKDDEGKVRGKRGFILFEEIGSYKNFKETWDNVRDSVKDGEEVFSLLYGVGCVCAGTKVWLPDGRQISIEDLKKEDGIYGFNGTYSVPEDIELLTTPKEKPCVKITLQDKTTLECSIDHPIYVQRKFSYKDYLGSYKYAEHATMHFRYEFIPAGELKVGDRVCEARRIPAFGNDTLFDARLVGMLIGDGSYGYDNTPKYSSEDKELLEYVEKRYETGLSASHITKRGNVYKDIRVKGICSYLREIGIYGQVKQHKRLPKNYQKLTKEDTCLMLAGIYDTDGTFIVKNQSIELCQSNREILEEIVIILRKLGIFGHIKRYEPRLLCGRKDKNAYYRLSIKGRVNINYFAENIPIICEHKKKALAEILDYFSSNPSKKEPKYDTSELEVSSVKSVDFIGDKLVYNMTVSGSHTYIANNIITHNTAGDDASDFAGVRTMLYNPDSYEVYALENVYDKSGKGVGKFAYFFPSYMSRTGCMDKDGNSDVVKALLSILMMRYQVKQGGDAGSLLSRIAQMPITPEEAILRVRSTFFPTVMLNERIRELDSHPHIYDDVYVGQLALSGGKVVFRSTDDIPIREYPVDNSTPGAIEIYSMPPEGEIPYNRFCIGCLTAGQRVSTLNGIKPVEEVTLDDKLINIDGKAVDIFNLQRRLVEDEKVYSIRLNDVYNRIELTGNHPVYAATPKKAYRHWTTHLKTGLPAVYYKYDFDFRRADELSVGDVVKSPVLYREEKELPYQLWNTRSRKGLTKIKCPFDSYKFWWLIGVILGDGWCSNKGVICVTFNTNETQYINRYIDAVKELFGKKAFISKNKGSCQDIQFSCIQLAEFFEANFGRYAKNKNIAEWVKYLPKKLKLALILGYFNSDGCCCKNSIEFVSISQKLLCDIQDILLSLGIVSSMKMLRDNGIHVINGRECQVQRTYSLSIARAGVETIGEWLGWKDIKLQHFNRRKTANHAIKRCWLSDDGAYVFYRISAIDIRGYSGIVYNFECETHTYMCDRLPVHNCDPVDNDQAESQSLMSVIVFDLFNDEIVAEYTGRQQMAEDGYEIVRLLALFYNAQVLYESNRKLMFSYFSKKHCLNMLAECPEWIRQKGLVKYSMFGSSAKGISVNGPLISTGIDLINDWLKKTYPVEVKDESGSHIEYVPQTYKIRNRALLQELVSYAPEKNTDRVSALFQVMFYREQFNILYGGAGADTIIEKDVSDDEFFDRDWKKYISRFGEEYHSAFDL